jgi:serine phosphatase RsbU (regulator of sigma subunit)/anti-sigma regulatory factor (Ser/Thr protein kinase)
LNLGPRLSEQEYSRDDRDLLANLATQAAPAVRVAQLVRQQQTEIQARERIEQELRVARLIQQTLLPKDVPSLRGWHLAKHYQPARAVGGDFYDFLALPDGRLAIVVGDVTDKGVPAALVMATTRSILRGALTRLSSPGQVLERVNELLCPDMPPNMFVTCLYAILDPANGLLQFANAGHDLPYHRRVDGAVVELHATGMPLGLLADMRYEEHEITLAPGDSVLLYSDGLVEAHAPSRQIFGFPRLRDLLADHPALQGPELIDLSLTELRGFTGGDWEQEDDITLVTLQRSALAEPEPALVDRGLGAAEWHTLATLTFPSLAGNERVAMDHVARVVREAVVPQSLPADRLERLKTAVAEATMNAIEHGNKYRADLPVEIEVRASGRAFAVRISDFGGDAALPSPAEPNIEAKLAGLQTPRGWGMFLIKNLMDEMHVSGDGIRHTIELVLYREGVSHAGQAA